MNSRERVAAAFAGEPTDRVPIHHIGFSSDVASGLLGREAYVGGGIQQWREVVSLWQGKDAHNEFLERSFRDAIDLAVVCENDIIRPRYWSYGTKPTRRIDENTFLFEYGPEDAWRVLRYDPPSEQCNVFYYRARPESTFDDLERQVAAAETSLSGFRPTEEQYGTELRAQRLLRHERAVRVGGVGIGIPHDAIWLEAILLRPDLVSRHLDVEAEKAVRTVPFLAQHGFRYLFGGGDFSSNAGPMYSPRALRELLLPRLQRVSRVCHDHGVYHLFASDGDLWPVADDLFGRSGVDGFYEIDGRAGMDLRRLRERFPKLTLIGNISSHTVHLGSKQEIVDEAMTCLEEARRSGRIIVGTSNYFVPSTPVDHVVLLLETISKHR